MPSLDGYSLNEKMDRLYEEIQAQIEQLQKDFHNLYNYMQKMEGKLDAKSTKKSSKVKKTKEKSLEHAKA